MSSLDAEEQALLESVEQGEWHSISNSAQEIQQYQRYARSQALEEIKLELPVEDLRSLQALAQQTGTPIPVLVANMIHQFVTRQSSGKVADQLQPTPLHPETD
jgi:predicted DNA binding CopG/RHH family protein